MNEEIKVKFQKGMHEDTLIFQNKLQEAFDESNNCMLGDYITLFQLFTAFGLEILSEKENKLAREFSSSPEPISNLIEEVVIFLSEKLGKFTQICKKLDKMNKKSNGFDEKTMH